MSGGDGVPAGYQRGFGRVSLSRGCLDGKCTFKLRPMSDLLLKNVSQVDVAPRCYKWDWDGYLGPGAGIEHLTVLIRHQKCMKQIFSFPNIEKLYHSKNNCISKD